MNQSKRFPRYFYLNGELHKKVFINRPTDVLLAYAYKKRERRVYSYSQTAQALGPAFTFTQAGKLLNRTHSSVTKVFQEGKLPYPEITHGIDGRGPGKDYQYMLSEDDVIQLWEYYRTQHYGKPRKDGLTTPLPLPTLRELKAMMRNEDVLYIKTENGFVPTWKVEEF